MRCVKKKRIAGGGNSVFRLRGIFACSMQLEARLSFHYYGLVSSVGLLTLKEVDAFNELR